MIVQDNKNNQSSESSSNNQNQTPLSNLPEEGIVTSIVNEKYSHKKIKLLSMILVLVLSLIIVLLMLFFFFKKLNDKKQLIDPIQENQTTTPTITAVSTSNPTPSTTPTFDPISGWNIYENTNFMFTFKYPSDWIVTFDNEDKTTVIVDGGEFESNVVDFIVCYPNSESVEQGVCASFTSFGPSDYSYEDGFDDYLIENADSYYPYSIGEVNGIFTFEEDPPYENAKRKIFLTEHNKYNYIVELVWNNDVPNGEDMLNEILSTFEFIDIISDDN